jgi:hypothetical protein
MIVIGIFALAATLRVVIPAADGTLTQAIGFDDSVYFFASQHLWMGSLPYRDFLFIHPPGILVALSPFAWLAAVVPDSVAMTVATIAFGLLGAGAAAMVAMLLMRYGRLSAVAGGGTYSVWSAAVWSDTAPLQAPLVSTAVLGALVLLTRTRTPHPIVAGLLLGFGMTVKMWAVVPVAVFAVLLLVRHGKVVAAKFAGAAAAMTIAICMPFFVLAPADMFHAVIGVPTGRPRAQGFDERVFYFSGSILHHDRLPAPIWVLIGVTGIALCALPLAKVLVARDIMVVGARAGSARNAARLTAVLRPLHEFRRPGAVPADRLRRRCPGRRRTYPHDTCRRGRGGRTAGTGHRRRPDDRSGRPATA